jgi:ribosomal protein L37AE/L43A
VSQVTPGGSHRDGERNPPFHCPYCGETDLRPVPEGRWHCRACLRHFSVSYHGTGIAEGAT